MTALKRPASGQYPVSPSAFITFCILVPVILSACSGKSQEASVTLSVSDEQAGQSSRAALEEVSPTVHAGDLDISLWASEELVADPVALHVDHQGRVWITSTERRRKGDIDIRGHRDWMIESMAMETVEDRRAFLHEKLAPEKSAENQWLLDRFENGTQTWPDLTTVKESVYRLEDLTGNGYANESDLFIKDFNEEITDVAGAILYHEGDVFLGVSPDLWRIRDQDGDGRADSKESISHGYGVHLGFGGHGMSGLTLGPDGRIYWSVGDVGANITDKEGRQWSYPNEGVIVRSEPDGSNFEVYAAGLRNTHEFTFDKYGNLITVDNDGDHDGEQERIVYLVDGSDSGWRINWQFGKYTDPKNNDYKVLMEEDYHKPRFDDQAAHILPPLASYHSGPTGMSYNPGTALSDKWKDHFFMISFRGSAVNSALFAFTLTPSGASFELDTDQMVMEGILGTGMHFGPDGALYFADWIEGWETKGRGRIWKMDTVADRQSAIRTETKNLLGEDFNGRSPDELLGLLRHADMRVRKKAQFELAGRNETQTLLRALEQQDHQLARVHGIWGLAQIGRKTLAAVEPLAGYLNDPDPEIRAQAAKMLGDVRYSPAGDALIPLLEDDHARVRLMATEALGRLAYRRALQPVTEMLQANDDEDVYLRHSGAIALARFGDGEAVAGLATHPSRAVRIAAVVALKRLGHPGAARFLNDEDEFIVTNAARAINDDIFIEEAIPDLARMLDQSRFTNEPLLRRSINANLFSGTPADARRLAAFSIRDDISEELRIEALSTLSVWPEPSVLDRVTGMHRGQVQNSLEDAHDALEPVIAQHLAGHSPALKMACLKTASLLRYTGVVSEVADLLAHDPSAEVRIASLTALLEMGYDSIGEVIAIALDDEDRDVRMYALSLITNLDLPAPEQVGMLENTLENGSVAEQQTALETLGTIDDPSSIAALDRQLELLIAGTLPPEIQLDLMLAVKAVHSQSLEDKLGQYETGKSREDSLSYYQASLHGGDAEVGRRIFYRHEGAQCIRCHAVGGDGSEVGPDLEAAGSRLTREEMLEAMVDPAASLAFGYGVVALRLNDGETVRGILVGETDTQITVKAGDQQVEVDKTRISERVNSPSGMPAMGTYLTRSELRDLVEFLVSLKATGVSVSQ